MYLPNVFFNNVFTSINNINVLIMIRTANNKQNRIQSDNVTMNQTRQTI